MEQQDLKSNFNQIGICKVLEDKEIGSDILLVSLIETFPGSTGLMVADTQTIDVKGKDSTGKEYGAKTNTDNVIKAHWLSWGSQRITSPDMRRKMRVMVYRYADTDEYYWEDMGLDSHLMRLETVVWGINNNPDGTGASSISPKNMHTLEFSSHTKQLTLRTCKTQGEPTAYVFQLNLGGGSVTLADDLGNALSLDSTEAIWHIQNTFGSFFTMDKNNILAFAAELIDMKTKLVNVQAETVKITANLFSGDISKLFHVNTPQANFSGNVTVGQISTGYDNNGSGMVSKGNMRIEGTLVVTGDAEIGGKVTCAGVDSSRNVNAPNI